MIQACGDREENEKEGEGEEEEDDDESIEGIGQDLSDGEDDGGGRRLRGPKTVNESEPPKEKEDASLVLKEGDEIIPCGKIVTALKDEGR